MQTDPVRFDDIKDYLNINEDKDSGEDYNPPPKNLSKDPRIAK